MSVRTNSRYEEAEEEGETELVLIILEYTGGRSQYSNNSMRQEGYYPSLDTFQNGETKPVLLDSRGLGWWEGHADFEVHYDEETFARSLLELNFIPDQIMGPNFDPDIRDRVMEKLDLGPFTGEDDLREQLREIVGMDEEDDEAIQEPDSRAEDLASDTPRSVLIKVANSYDDSDELLEQEDKASISHVSNTALAEFLADKPNQEVNRRIDTAEMGGDL